MLVNVDRYFKILNTYYLYFNRGKFPKKVDELEINKKKLGEAWDKRAGKVMLTHKWRKARGVRAREVRENVEHKALETRSTWVMRARRVQDKWGTRVRRARSTWGRRGCRIQGTWDTRARKALGMWGTRARKAEGTQGTRARRTRYLAGSCRSIIFSKEKI